MLAKQDTQRAMVAGRLAVADVIVGDRARKDDGDLTSLVESIREHGLLQPIGVLPGNRACRRAVDRR